MRYNAAEFSERLRNAKGEANLSTAELQRRAQAQLGPNRRGLGYGTVYSWINGQAPHDEPDRSAVEALAAVLEIRPEYLLYGGPRTTAGEVAHKRSSAAPWDVSISADELEAAFLEGLPALANAGPAAWHAIAEFCDFLFVAANGRTHIERSMKDARKRSGNVRSDAEPWQRAIVQVQYENARNAARAIGATAAALGIDLNELTRWQLDRYIQLSVLACQSIL